MFSSQATNDDVGCRTKMPR